MALDYVGMVIGGNTYKNSRENMKSCKPNFHYKLYMNQDKTKKEKVQRESSQFYNIIFNSNIFPQLHNVLFVSII